MARADEEELLRLAGNHPHEFVSTDLTPPQKRLDNDLDSKLQQLLFQHLKALAISNPEMEVERFYVPEKRINTQPTLQYMLEDPEHLLENDGWPYQKGPEDYPEPNEG